MALTRGYKGENRTPKNISKLTIIDGGNYSASEINAAQYMTNLGNDVVLDLSNTTVTVDDLGNISTRVKGAIEKKVELVI